MTPTSTGRGADRADVLEPDPFARLVQEHLRPALSERRIGRDAPVILIQAHKSPKYHVAAALLGVALALEHEARIAVYRFVPAKRWEGLRPRIAASLRRAPTGDGPRGSRGGSHDWDRLFADEIIDVRIRRADLERADALLQSYLASGPTVADLERVELDGVNLGEVLIDKIVQKGFVEVNPLAPELLTMMRTEAARLSALQRTVERRDVVAMVAIDVAYAPGLSLRLALHRGIDAYVTHHRQSVHLTPEHPFTGLQSLAFPGILASLDPEVRLKLRRAGDRFLASRLLPGGTGFTATDSSVWSDSPSPFLDRLDRGKRKVVLVAAHSFYDAQHAGGPFLFSDFFAWFEHLHELSGRVDHLWLIKLHPDSRDTGIGVRSVAEQLFADRANVAILPEEVTQRQLLDFGVDVVHTIYGTVAMEFPYLGVGAITARTVSTHSPFSYALVPSSVEELDRMLLDPGAWTYPIDTDGLLEYAALQYLVRRTALQEILSAAPGEATEEFPWTQDWMSMITHDSFRHGLDRFRRWIASGDHSAAHWFGRQQLLGRLTGDQATNEAQDS